MTQTNRQINPTNPESLADRKKVALWHWSHLIYQAALEASVATASYAAAIERVKTATQALGELHPKTPISGVTQYLSPETQPKFALMCWAKTLYDSALQACEETDAYVGGNGNIRYARTVVKAILRKAEQDLKTLGGRAISQALTGSSPCNNDQECPDYAICVEGNCEPL